MSITAAWAARGEAVPSRNAQRDSGPARSNRARTAPRAAACSRIQGSRPSAQAWSGQIVAQPTVQSRRTYGVSSSARHNGADCDASSLSVRRKRAWKRNQEEAVAHVVGCLVADHSVISPIVVGSMPVVCASRSISAECGLRHQSPPPANSASAVRSNRSSGASRTAQRSAATTMQRLAGQRCDLPGESRAIAVGSSSTGSISSTSNRSFQTTA